MSAVGWQVGWRDELRVYVGTKMKESNIKTLKKNLLLLVFETEYIKFEKRNIKNPWMIINNTR